MVEIVASASGKINTGSYENVDPFFSIKEVLDLEMSDEEKSARQKELYLLCKQNFDQAFNIIKGVDPEAVRSGVDMKKIAEAFKNIRFYEHGFEKYPSVTSILGYFAEPFDFPKDELKKLADRGTVIHALCEYYMKEGEWLVGNDLMDLKVEAEASLDKPLIDAIETVINNGLFVDDVNFIDFLEKYPLTYIDSEFTVISEEFQYAGRCDLKAMYDGKVTLCDYKTGGVHKDKTKKALEQLSAYAKGDGMEDVQQIMVIPLNHKTKQGWSKPTIASPDEHWDDFLAKRRRFYKELGC